MGLGDLGPISSDLGPVEAPVPSDLGEPRAISELQNVGLGDLGPIFSDL